MNSLLILLQRAALQRACCEPGMDLGTRLPAGCPEESNPFPPAEPSHFSPNFLSQGSLSKPRGTEQIQIEDVVNF